MSRDFEDDDHTTFLALEGGGSEPDLVLCVQRSS